MRPNLRNPFNNNNNLELCHLNCQSLCAHFADLVSLVDLCSYCVIGVSETWLTPLIWDKTVDIPGYNIFRNDRIGKRGGGVALYVREDLNVK